MVPGVVQAAVRQPVVDAKADNGGVTDSDPHSTSAHSSGTVVLDAEQGGIVVPDFYGKSVRAAIELAQDSGLEIDAIGSGLAQEQFPAAGTHVTSASRVRVRFGR